MSFRKLNEEGLARFTDWIHQLKSDGSLSIPKHLLTDPATSELLKFAFSPVEQEFSDRAKLGAWLNTNLSGHEAEILYDAGFWSALALFWFDQICAQRADGKRKPGEVARYVFDGRRKNYRHLIWATWWAINSYGADGRYLLLPVSAKDNPLEFGGGEVMGQIAANQMTTSSSVVIRLGRKLYSDPQTDRQNKGSSGKGADSPRRFVKVLRQFQLTYDFDAMTDDAIEGLLPKEFEQRLSASRKLSSPE